MQSHKLSKNDLYILSKSLEAWPGIFPEGYRFKDFLKLTAFFRLAYERRKDGVLCLILE